MAKYIFVTGGVVSGLGKGITLSSVGRILIDRGISVFVQKFDPYLNINAGTMSPFQHGEVFVTQDGAECDLDLGHYERFTDVDTLEYSNITAGKIYETILKKERNGDYLGQTIQVVPHVTNEIKRKIIEAGEKSKSDVVITEFGGTVGDIESTPFLEAARQIRRELGKDETLFIHITLVPYIQASGEFKTKPTQHSVRDLRVIGIQPDIIICRSQKELSEEEKRKISLFCDVNKESVIDMVDAENVYDIPSFFSRQELDKIVAKELKLQLKSADENWINFIKNTSSIDKTLKISLVGKYIKMKDAYLSVIEALKHAGYHLGYKIEINWIDAEGLNSGNYKKILSNSNGIIVPGGYGERAVAGKLLAIEYARINKIPFLGICLGLQLCAIEYARNVLDISGADSDEFVAHSPDNLISLNSDGQRLGAKDIKINENTLAAKLYKNTTISERHRHRYLINSKYFSKLNDGNFLISAYSINDNIAEIIELVNHPFFVACQFHPEFKSRPTKPHPLFIGLVEEVIKNL